VGLTLRRNLPDSCPSGFLPLLNMKKMRCLFLLLAFGFGLCPQRLHGQVVEQNMTFSIICQYVTNFVTVTNPATGVVTSFEQLNTVLVNTANIAKAITVQAFGTNWVQWSPANIFYEVNLNTGAQGIFLNRAGKQTNVSSFFGNSFTNVFSQNVNEVFVGTNYAASLPLGGDPNDQTAMMLTNINHFANLAYLSFATPNTSFNLFGYSQGGIVHAGAYVGGTLYQRYLDEGEIVGAGTFSLNVTTNIYRVPTDNGTPTNYTGVAHGTVYLGPPYFLSYVTNGP
jgi:hypothetical protein